MSELREGRALAANRGGAVKVGRYLGEGGQGVVHEVEYEGRAYALKWYHPPGNDPYARKNHEEQREALLGSGSKKGLIDRKPPNERFLWPLDYVEDDSGDFGYLMNLRPSRFTSLEEVMRGTVKAPDDQGPYRTLATACLGLVDCFRVLHLDGLVYKDINLGGPFFDFSTGEVLICDNDNVRVNNTPGTIFFYEFAAPEVVLGRAHCTTRTDEHSLAVLLFYIWVRGHPLEGARDAKLNVMNLAAKRKVYGERPIFTFHPEDESNRAVRGVHDAALSNWPRLPNFARALFLKAFTTGLTSPNDRINDTQWLEAMSRLRDSLYTCQHCRRETFYDRAVAQSGNETQTCGWCRKQNPLPARIRIGKDKKVVSLSERSRLYPHHMGASYDFSTPIAEVVQHPTNPNRWGLKNMTGKNWTYKTDEGDLKEIPPGRSLTLDKRREIHFGPVSGLLYPRG